MKTKSKLYKVAFICFGAGVLLLIAGLVLGGGPGFYIDSAGIHAAGRMGKSAYIMEKTELEAFDSMELELQYADVEIIPSDGFYVEYTLNGDAAKPEYEVEDKILHFTEGDRKTRWNVQFLSWDVLDKTRYEVKIYVPEEHIWRYIKIQQSDGGITLPDIRAEELEILQEYGDIKADTVKAKRALFSLSDGNLDILQGLDAEKTEITNGYGDVNVKTAESLEEFSLDLVTAYGHLSVQGHEVSSDEDGERESCVVQRDAKYELRIQNNDGDINVVSAK